MAKHYPSRVDFLVDQCGWSIQSEEPSRRVILKKDNERLVCYRPPTGFCPCCYTTVGVKHIGDGGKLKRGEVVVTAECYLLEPHPDKQGKPCVGEGRNPFSTGGLTFKQVPEDPHDPYTEWRTSWSYQN